MSRKEAPKITGISQVVDQLDTYMLPRLVKTHPHIFRQRIGIHVADISLVNTRNNVTSFSSKLI
jgi:hypothetical protein